MDKTGLYYDISAQNGDSTNVGLSHCLMSSKSVTSSFQPLSFKATSSAQTNVLEKQLRNSEEFYILQTVFSISRDDPNYLTNSINGATEFGRSESPAVYFLPSGSV